MLDDRKCHGENQEYKGMESQGVSRNFKQVVKEGFEKRKREGVKGLSQGCIWEDSQAEGQVVQRP